MGYLFGSAIDVDDPFFEETTDDPTIALQTAELALDTPLGSLDEFPDYGFDMRGTILAASTPTEIAMLPLEARSALEQEPSFASAEVTVTEAGAGPGPTVTRSLACVITTREGDAVGFTFTPGA
jgi:hypothetical protein